MAITNGFGPKFYPWRVFSGYGKVIPGPSPPGQGLAQKMHQDSPRRPKGLPQLPLDGQSDPNNDKIRSEMDLE